MLSLEQEFKLKAIELSVPDLTEAETKDLLIEMERQNMVRAKLIMEMLGEGSGKLETEDLLSLEIVKREISHLGEDAAKRAVVRLSRIAMERSNQDNAALKKAWGL